MVGFIFFDDRPFFLKRFRSSSKAASSGNEGGFYGQRSRFHFFYFLNTKFSTCGPTKAGT